MCQKGTFEKRYQAQVYHSFFNNFNPCTLNQMLNFDVATRERCRGLTGLREWGWTHFIDGELEHEHGPPPWRGPEACQVSTLNKSGDIDTGKPMQYHALTTAIDTHSILAKNKVYFCESLTLAPQEVPGHLKSFSHKMWWIDTIHDRPNAQSLSITKRSKALKKIGVWE